MRSQTLANLLIHGIHRIKAAATMIVERSNREAVTLTANQQAGDRRTEVLIAAKTLTDKHSGMLFFLGLAGGFTVTLPIPKEGLRFRFMVSVSPTTAYIITSNAAADVIIVGINELDVDTNDNGPYDINADVVTFVANTAVIGDYLDFECDGTKWYGVGQTNADGGITTATS